MSTRSKKSRTELFKTGEIAPRTGHYGFVEYLDGTTSPPPTWNEREIPLDRGDVFPPINSADKAAWWEFLR